MSLKDQIDITNLPKHIAIIMDGNGRWAKRHNKPRVFGHQNGVKAVRQVTEGAAELGIEHLTLYAFSQENWKRPAFEVNTLMKLFVKTVHKELDTLNDNSIKLNAIGALDKLPKDTYEALLKGMDSTQHNSRMTLHLALNYSSRWEILEAAKKIASEYRNGHLNIDDLSVDHFSDHLLTRGIPDPELMIRSSGERRISNFLLWQLSYSELYFTDVLWPEFDKEELYKAIISYQNRERRFGMTGEQLIKS